MQFVTYSWLKDLYRSIVSLFTIATLDIHSVAILQTFRPAKIGITVVLELVFFDVGRLIGRKWNSVTMKNKNTSVDLKFDCQKVPVRR